ncbi:hypothetical protein HID58_051109 [Brassica napus]|uniref:cathepsin H n=1 Tax=Brassica napus TaxID=3708 RepID=A0A816I2T6_BRANA|nr:thiol protease aleurain [Brassica napus]KAH0888680.1 hypothetical protein HID58_051109 [Brassica napus]CAF1698323.1 unnamed protein product [Brassica napus]
MSVRAITSLVVLVILTSASLAVDIGSDDSPRIRMVPDRLREIEESFVQILGKSHHVLSFARFTHQYGKMYQHAEEIKHRFSVFKENLDLIRSTNKKGLSYKLGVNKFADLTKQEFQRNKIDAASFATLKGSHNLTERALLETATPSVKDWREDGIVSSVRDQEQCEAGWAISSVGAVEAAHRKKYGIRISLSEQQLLDCSTNNNGCDGGFAAKAFQYIKERGLILRAVYPYESTQRICRHQLALPRVLIRSYRIGVDENELKQWVGSIGPVTIGFHVKTSFAFYESGVYTSSECGSTTEDLNHFMLVVGYGIEDGIPYWLVQNSWGTDWGEKGYIKVEMWKNMCGKSFIMEFKLYNRIYCRR